jgi:hypothetical protein
MESLVTGSKATSAVCPAKKQLGNLNVKVPAHDWVIQMTYPTAAHTKAKRLDSC